MYLDVGYTLKEGLGLDAANFELNGCTVSKKESFTDGLKTMGLTEGGTKNGAKKVKTGAFDCTAGDCTVGGKVYKGCQDENSEEEKPAKICKIPANESDTGVEEKYAIFEETPRADDNFTPSTE